ncbi:MAG TPA: DUF1273 domain-containing protein [Cerasibacillus sp.]|uniref:DUF1273 domain-containing protein n=1 Tax=Cerasibacillus sp. TaxID=2498711 RepID=UPI002F40EE20
MKVLAVTGYKPMEMNIFKHDDERIEFIKYALKKRLIQYIEEGLEWVLISGQMGVEIWTGEVLLDLKETYPIQLAVIPPFENMDQRWPEPQQFAYQELLIQADFYKPLYQGEYKGPYQFRAMNQWLIEKSDGCLFLVDEDFPGSNRFLLDAAKSKANYPILTLTPTDLDDAVLEWQMSDPRYWDS